MKFSANCYSSPPIDSSFIRRKLPFIDWHSARPSLPRLQLFEFNDQPWFKGFWREAFMDCLNFYNRFFDFYGGLAKHYDEFARRGRSDVVLDMASGGGEHFISLTRGATKAGVDLPKVVLSDLFPPLTLFEELQDKLGADKISFQREPVSALHIQPSVCELRSIFNAFHHFTPDEARALLEDALHNGKGIFIAEIGKRTWRHLLTILSGLGLGLLSPFFSKRFQFKKLLVTTIIPIIPLIVCWDGLVSIVRLYSPQELEELIPPRFKDKVEIQSASHWFTPWLDSQSISILRKN